MSATHPEAAATIRAKLASVTIKPSDPAFKFRNWSRSYYAVPHSTFAPETEEQCALIVRLAQLENQPIRAVGVGHSPSDLPCTSGFMVRMTKLKSVVEVNSEKQLVTVQAGIVLSELHQRLNEHGLAMTNLGSISDITLGGMIGSGTHGTGIDFGICATQVSSLDLLLADGSRARCSRTDNEELFMATLSGLGATGLILQVTLQVEPAFNLRDEHSSVEIDYVIDHFEDLMRSAEHVRMWWSPHRRRVVVASANRTTEIAIPTPAKWFWESIFSLQVVQFSYLIAFYFPAVGYWISSLRAGLALKPRTLVDASHRIFNLDCDPIHTTTEWSIPFSETRAVLKEMQAWFEEEYAAGRPLPDFPVEMRVSSADDIWMSASNGQATTWIGVVKFKPYHQPSRHAALFTRFESIIAKHTGRPHWAKTHFLTPSDVRALYPRFDDWRRVVRAVDPNGTFSNPYVHRHMFDDSGRSALVPSMFTKDT